ncbi:MAG TPA: protein phosphatase CheZ [Gammaproteobacteria bacterium]|nr:protein phosphatase CheZ [Gammaproteobacteria bacterium]
MVDSNGMQQLGSGSEIPDVKDILEKSRSMVTLLEQGQTDAAVQLLNELARMRERELFAELGRLTRHLHDALKSVRLGDEVSELVNEFPDARQRLGYVVRLTEEAANKTLSIIEGLIPKAEAVSSQAEQLLEQLQTFESTAGVVNSETAALHTGLRHYLKMQINSGWHEALSEIMMAQDFQDITGQIIQRVSLLVGDIEMGLVDILRKNPFAGEESSRIGAREQGLEMGPAVPGIDDADRLDNQDDVDQLLMEYGF